MTSRALIAAFAQWAAEAKPLVLATVFETDGSTYSKAGARMLITGEATFQGMLSGGCLEGDLAERAKAVIETGQSQAVTYDLGQNDEELWGLGVGCDGLMRIFLQPLSAKSGYQPFAAMSQALDGDDSQLAATVVTSDIDELPAGATLVTVNGATGFSDIPAAFADDIQALVEQAVDELHSKTFSLAGDKGAATVLLGLLTPPPKVLVLGAGLDAGPVVRFARELGWRVTVQDHRPAYIESAEFAEVDAIHCLPVDEFSKVVELNSFAAVIVMSHHLASDRKYLAQLAGTEVRYIGLLGPVDRRRRLLEELGEVGVQMEGRVHGPAGIDIGGRGPAAIALSIVAEMHQQLMLPAAN